MNGKETLKKEQNRNSKGMEGCLGDWTYYPIIFQSENSFFSLITS